MCRAKILAVDDEENFLYLMTRVLIKEGYEVKTVPNGQEALEKMKKEAFDIALLDIRMPFVDGLSVLRNIKQLYPAMKVIIITAYPSKDTRMLSLEEGAYSYLVKPVDIDDLKHIIRGALSLLDSGERHL